MLDRTESLGLRLTPLVRPQATDLPPAGIGVSGGYGDDPALSWQSSIGQIIFLQSVMEDRV